MTVFERLEEDGVPARLENPDHRFQQRIGFGEMVKNRAAEDDVGKAFGKIIALRIERDGGATITDPALSGLAQQNGEQVGTDVGRNDRRDRDNSPAAE